jgi:predicted permease
MMRFYRALLYLYPTSFRAEYASELCDAFAMRRAGSNGFLGAVATVFAAIADVVPNAMAAHWDVLRQDLRYTLRGLRKAPGFAITAILVVALGVGANTAAFSVADFVLFRPLPFPQPERLTMLWERTPGYQMEFSPGNYADYKAEAKSFSSMGAYFSNAMNLTGSGEPRRIEATRVTWDLFPTLGARAFAGRLFSASDTVAGQSIVISHDLWQTQFGGDAKVIGKSVQLDGAPYIVIGIMPQDFHFPNREIEIWKTMQFTTDDLAPRNDNFIYVVGRLKSGVSIDAARAEAAIIAKRLEARFPVDNKDTGASITRLSDQLSDRARLLLLALCGASLCILLLACANLGNLMLARAVARERELAVRAALGAGRERLLRQIVTESVLLSALGGLASVVVAIIAVPMLARLVPSTLPIAQQPTIDPRVLAFAGVLVLVTGLAFSLAPALRASNATTLAGLRNDARSGGGARQRVRSILVVVEVMASVVLLISSGLLVRAMWKLQAVDPGFRVQNILTLRTALPWPKYEDPRARQPFYDKVLSELKATPGVQSAAYISFLPMVMRGGIWPVTVNSAQETRNAASTASLRFITPRFFSTLQIPLEVGRQLEESDDNSRENVAIVSESFVKKYWPGETPVGKRFKFAMRERTIVGVVGDIRVRGLEQSSEPQVYLPYKQVDSASLIGYVPKDLVVRSTLPIGTLLPAIRRIVHEADPAQPISDVQTMDEIVANETASRLAQLRVLMILAALALVLSAVGIHGLLSFTVSRRSREIGVRMALGAESSRVRGMVLREGLVLALAGILPGAALAYAAGRAMQALLVGVSPRDGMTFALAIGLCVVTTVFGCLRPALRASRVDPMSAIRAE